LRVKKNLNLAANPKVVLFSLKPWPGKRVEGGVVEGVGHRVAVGQGRFFDDAACAKDQLGSGTLQDPKNKMEKTMSTILGSRCGSAEE
jgi:hypothetical protein